MKPRDALVALIVVATVCFVIGTTIERSSADTHSGAASTVAPSGEAGAEHRENGETGEAAGEGGRHSKSDGETTAHSETGSEKHSEGRILGLDIEAVPFVVLAALASLALAAGVWLRPGLVPMLVTTAVAMLIFSALDIREVVHQGEESRAGLAAFAAVIALLHLAAGAVAARMTRGAQRSGT